MSRSRLATRGFILGRRLISASCSDRLCCRIRGLNWRRSRLSLKFLSPEIGYCIYEQNPADISYEASFCSSYFISSTTLCISVSKSPLKAAQTSMEASNLMTTHSRTHLPYILVRLLLHGQVSLAWLLWNASCRAHSSTAPSFLLDTLRYRGCKPAPALLCDPWLFKNLASPSTPKTVWTNTASCWAWFLCPNRSPPSSALPHCLLLPRRGSAKLQQHLS